MTDLITTKRLTLRSFTSDDCDWLASGLVGLDIARWIPDLPFPYCASDAHDFVALQSGPKADALVVTRGDSPIGCITKVMELGYWFAKDAWGQGFATEAARAIAARHFDAGHDRLESGYQLGNARSFGVLAKLGFVPTEQVTRASISLGQNVTVQRMVLSRDNWLAHK